MASFSGNKRKKRKKEPWTYTKWGVFILLVIGIVNAEIPYVLSAFGKDPVSPLAELWILNIIVVFFGYMVKSYFGKKNEEIQITKRMELNIDKQSETTTTSGGFSDDEIIFSTIGKEEAKG